MTNRYSFLRTWGLAASLGLAGSLAAHAQLAYPAAASQNVAGTYTDVSTVAGSTAIATSTNDDANSAAQNIGFSFNYNGLSFTQFVLNTNGFIRLGSAPPSAANLFLTDNSNAYPGGPFVSTDPADVNLIAPFNCDLKPGTSTPDFRLATTGTAPNRVCTIQWKNMRDKLTPPAVQMANIAFQVKLYETTNAVEFVYGTWTAGTNGASAFKSAICGLKGSNDGPDNFLTVWKYSSDAFSLAAFQANNYDETTSSLGVHFNYQRSFLPDAGRTFRFVVPTCPQPTDLAVSKVTETEATVDFTGPANGTAYSLIYGPTGFDPATGGTTVAAAAAPYTLSGLASGTTYDVYVQAQCGSTDQSLTTGPVTFNTVCAASQLVINTFPYVENFDSTPVTSLPCGITVLDANADNNPWFLFTDSLASPPHAIVYAYSDTEDADDWFFTPALNLKAGNSYQLEFKFAAYDGDFPEALEVKYGTSTAPADQTNLLFSNTNIDNIDYETTTPKTVAAITPTADGTYYIGFHAISLADQFALTVDDVTVTASQALGVKNGANTVFRAEAAPVPFDAQLSLHLNTRTAGPAVLTLRDALGRTVRQARATVAVGSTTLAVPDVASLPAGVYFLYVEQGGAKQVVRVSHQ